MAKLTNRHNIPQQIVSAIMRDPYSRGTSDISVTQLIQPPRIIQLRKRHQHEIEEDASDRIWSLLGQTCHKILERSDQTGAIHEERLRVEVGGYTVSGQSDCYVTQQANFETGKYENIPPTIRDYKFIKTTAAGFAHPDWEQQTNILAYLWREKGFPVEKLEVVAIYRDWSKVLALRSRDYPPSCQTFTQKLWGHEEAEEFIRERVALHQVASRLEDDFLPMCTQEEQWRRPRKYAVMHPKKTKAVRLLDSHDEAESYINTTLKGCRAHYIEYRPGVATKCDMFCDVNPFCGQYRAEKAAAQKEAA